VNLLIPNLRKGVIRNLPKFINKQFPNVFCVSSHYSNDMRLICNSMIQWHLGQLKNIQIISYIMTYISLMKGIQEPKKN
jgi:hypothetical protein